MLIWCLRHYYFCWNIYSA